VSAAAVRPEARGRGEDEMDKTLLYQHVSQIGKNSEDWRNYPPVGDVYPVLLDGYIAAFEEKKKAGLRIYAGLQTEQARKNAERDRAKNARDATIAGTNLAVNYVLYTLKLLTYYYKLTEENYDSINNLVKSVFNIREGQQVTTRHVVEEIIRWLEETLLHRYGLISEATLYDRFSSLDLVGEFLTSFLPGEAGGASRPGTPSKSTFPGNYFGNLFDYNFDYVADALLHEALHRVSYSDFVIDHFRLDDYFYHEQEEFGAMDASRHLKNADSFSHATIELVKLKMSPRKRLPYDRPVVLDDTLWKIAFDEYGKGSLYWVIWEANKGRLRSGNEDMIFPGEILTIPVLPKGLQNP
jgi:hypothetical protein